MSDTAMPAPAVPFAGLPWSRAQLEAWLYRVGNSVDTCDFGSTRAVVTLADAIEAARRNGAPTGDRFPGLPASIEALTAFVQAVARSYRLHDFNSATAINAMARALFEAAQLRLEARPPPAPWIARREPDGATILLDGDRVVARVLAEGMRPWEAARLALAPRMLAVLADLVDGRAGPDVWRRASALVRAAELG